MLVEVKRIWCPTAELNLAAWKREQIVKVCMSIAGNCKVCPHGIVTTGFRLVRKPKTIQTASRNECPGC